jgi:hypothetical protein
MLMLPALALALWSQGTSLDPLPELVPEILALELEAHVRFLASDELAGRALGSPGLRRAADYLARALAAYGLEPAGDAGSYLQAVPLLRVLPRGAPTLEFTTQGGERVAATWGVDFRAQVRGRPDPERSLRLRVVRSEAELPAKASSEEALLVSAPARTRRAWLEARGWERGRGFALDVLEGPKTAGQPGGTESAQLGPLREPQSADSITLRGPLLERALAGDFVSVKLRWQVSAEELADANVVAVKRGKDPRAIVFSAHYDHIGEAPAQADAPSAGDRVFNGADDDASGCALLLELAGALAALESERTLIFLFATGEERGLIGTERYLDAPAVPLERTLANVNFEMIGRPDELAGGFGALWLTGFDKSNLGPAWRELGLAIVADPRPEQNFYERSDNIAFVRRGIVGQTLSSYNLHSDYHRVSDHAELLDYEHMQAAARMVLGAVQPLCAGTLEPRFAGQVAR